MNEVLEFYPLLIKGTITTIQLTVMGAILALIVSFIVGIARISSFASVRVAAIIYLEFFVAVQLLFRCFLFILFCQCGAFILMP